MAVIGSRSFHDYDLLHRVLSESLSDGDIIVSGGCPLGADFFAEEYAKATGTPIEVYPADWSVGRGAGFIRNGTIEQKSDACIAFWDRRSNGTADTMKKFDMAGKPVKMIPFSPFYVKEVTLEDMFE